jgi:hypothetical protein
MTFLRVTLASALVLGAGILSVEMSPAEAQQARPQVRTQPNAGRINLPANVARIPSAPARPVAARPAVAATPAARPQIVRQNAVAPRPAPTSSGRLLANDGASFRGLVGNAGGTLRR